MLLGALLLSCGCASTSPPGHPSAGFTLDQLLLRMPSRDTLEAQWIFSSMLRMGPDSVLDICNRLEPGGTRRNAGAEYALQGVAGYVVGRGSETERLAFVSALARALDQPRPPEQCSFILARLQVAGRSESIPTASRFLGEEILCEPAAQAMVAIREGAEPAFLAALPAVQKSCRVTILKSLGDLRARGAVEAIMKEAASDDPGVRLAAAYALANIGDSRGESIVTTGVARSPIRDRDECLSYHLLYARRRIEAGDSAPAITLGNELLYDRGPSDHVRSAALGLLVQAKEEAAVEDLLRVMADSSRQLRSVALAYTLKIPGEGITGRWIAASKNIRPEARSEILSMLGRRGDPGAYAALVDAFQDADGSVRAAAIDAAVRLKHTDVIEPLLAFLRQSVDVSDIAAARKALQRLPADRVIPPCVESLPLLTPQACVMVLDLLGTYGTAVPAGPVTAVAKKDTGPVRIAAVKALGSVGDEETKRELIVLLQGAGEGSELAAAQKSLVSICARGPDPEKRADVLLDSYESSGTKERMLLLPVIGRIGGSRALAVVSREARNSSSASREAAVRALADWPALDAYDTLLAVARSKEKLNLRVLALRGCVRVVQNAPIVPPSAVRYHEKTLAAAERLEEKRLVLGALANLKTPSALKAVVPLIGDDSLGLDAAMAAGRISSGGTESNDALSSSQVARAFIESAVSARYRSQVQRALEATPGMNSPAEGFRALFNGRDLEGWKGLVENPVVRSRMTAAQLTAAQAEADSIMRAHWSIVDGVLQFDGKGESLCTAEEFADVELMVDWKIEKGGDSGIYLRGSPQVQIWDPAQWPEGSGGLYNNQKNPSKPLQCADNPVGEWNTFRIRMVDDKVTVYLNGILVVDSVALENYWDRSIPIFPAGQIELQSHNSPLAFRNISVREIPRRMPLSSGKLFNGIDLRGWTVIGGKQDAWGVSGEVLYTTGEGGGWLSTDRTYDNFQLDLDFRLPDGGNSGVFLRAPHEGDPAYTGMEIQVLDDYAPEYAALQPWQYCGSLYGVVAASKRVSRKANEWQHYRIVACGPRVRVMLNGETIVDADLIRHMDKESTHPGLKRRSGYIGLQSHTRKVEYRNITLTELEWRE
jgi:HEAT repeat protein